MGILQEEGKIHTKIFEEKERLDIVKMNQDHSECNLCGSWGQNYRDRR